MTGLAHRGTVAAAAILLDVGLLGEDEARRRVLELWRGGTKVREVPGGHWLVILDRPVLLRRERAPGLALVAAERGLAEPGLPGRPDAVVISRHGQVSTWPLAELPAVSQAGWVDVGELPVHRLTCLDEPTVAAPAVDDSVRPEPDLRATARIGPPSATARRLAGNPGESGRAWATAAGALAVGAGVVLALALLVALLSVMGATRSPLPVFPVVVLIWVLVSRLNRDPGAARTAKARGPGWLAPLILRSPAGWLIRSRHERYLARLSRQFESRHWDEALRDAIGLGSGAGRGWTLRVPRPRASLTPTLSRRAGGPGVPYGPQVYRELQALYRTAATDLESAGRIEQAAFVYSDLLDDPATAVGVLERHGHLRLAAELAESRELDPNLVVRLWWRAGRRDRAVAVARVRGAFAAAIDRLSTVDNQAAVELRREWVHTCRRAGDLLGAVLAAWPEESLRPMVFGDLEATIARGGPNSARLSAYLVTGRPTPAALGTVLDLLAGTGPELRAERDQFVAALATLSSADPAQDRQLCTAALRSVVRDGIPATEWSSGQRTLRRLRDRADPLAAVEVAALAARRRPSSGSELRLSAPAEPGQLPVYDVAALPGDGLLVAHGDLGARLLTVDGRVHARWDVPTHRLVVADHGGTALLITRQGTITEAHRLDLDTRRVRPWTTFEARWVLPSYDGGTLAVLDRDGLAFLDTLADHPRILWRELARDIAVHTIGRTPDRLTALVTAPSPVPGHPSQAELWSWELPTLTLRLRSRMPAEVSPAHAAVVGAAIVTLVPTADEQLDVRRCDSGKAHTDLRVPAETVLRTNGNAYLTQAGTEITAAQPRQPVMHVCFPTDAPVGLRQHAGMINLWDREGRIVCADPARPAGAIALRTTL
jgi:hypothetical protein